MKNKVIPTYLQEVRLFQRVEKNLLLRHNSMMNTFNIAITSKLTGLTEHTLRAWEKRYKVVTPLRNKSGHRVYTQEEVDLLHILSQLCTQGHKISKIKDKSFIELKQLLTDLGFSQEILKPIILNDSPLIIEKALSKLLIGLESYRLDIVSHEFYNLKMKFSHRDLALNIISPLMKAVGEKVEQKKYSIAQEHAISSIIKFHLGQFLFSSQIDKKRTGRMFVLSTPEGDYHEFGILLASLLCAHYNHDFLYLGPNMPAQSLSHAIKALDADEIILGSVNYNNSSDSLFLDTYIANLLKGIGKKKKLLIGGTGYFDYSKFKDRKNFSFISSLNELDKYLENHK